MRRRVSAVVMLSVLALSGRAEASVSGPTGEQVYFEIGVNVVHLASLGTVTLGDIFSGSKGWRTATFVAAPANILLSLGAVLVAGSDCCSDDHRNSVVVIESISVAWSIGLLVWAILTRSPEPPPVAAAVLPSRRGATANFFLTL